MSQLMVILGTGGSAYVLIDVVDAINAIRPTWEPIGFLDDAKSPGSQHLGLKVLGPLSDAPKFGDCVFVNTIGSEKSYRRRPEILASTGLATDRFATLVHPGASVSERARLGRGVWVNFGVTIDGGATVGDHVTIGSGVFVGHDAVIEDFTCLSPGTIVCGFVRVDRASFLGRRNGPAERPRGAGRWWAWARWSWMTSPPRRSWLVTPHVSCSDRLDSRLSARPEHRLMWDQRDCMIDCPRELSNWR